METITLIADRDAKSPVAEAYRTIRTNIQFSNVGQELKTIIVTSATPNEGKSTTISNLAVVMAQAGHKVLLMDCDMRNPTQHKLFKLTNKGLSNCISASEEVREVIQKNRDRESGAFSQRAGSAQPIRAFGKQTDGTVTGTAKAGL